MELLLVFIVPAAVLWGLMALRGERKPPETTVMSVEQAAHAQNSVVYGCASAVCTPSRHTITGGHRDGYRPEREGQHDSPGDWQAPVVPDYHKPGVPDTTIHSRPSRRTNPIPVEMPGINVTEEYEQIKRR